MFQDKCSGSLADGCSKMEESSDGDYGLEALRAGLSVQSTVPQLVPCERLHVCWECGERFQTLHDLMEHFDQHPTSGHCQLCQVKFRRGASLALHLENAHKNTPLVCPSRNCSEQLLNRWLLNRHIETCHTDDCVEAGVEVEVEVAEEVVVAKEEVVEEEEEEGKREPLLPGQQNMGPGCVLEHMANDHSYYSTRVPGRPETDHTYNTRERTAVSHAYPGPQYELSGAALRTTVGPRSVQHGATDQQLLNKTVKDQEPEEEDFLVEGEEGLLVEEVDGEEGLLVEGAPLQWDEDGDFGDIGDMEEDYDDSGVKSSDSDGTSSETASLAESLSDEEDSDSDSDSLPPGDSMYVPEEHVMSDSDSHSSDSFSSTASDSYTKSVSCVPSGGVKQELHTLSMDSGTVVEPLSTLSTSSMLQTCPHCRLGPFHNLRNHIAKCCSRGPERCAKCRKVFSEGEYICVDCNKTFLGTAARKAHVCPMKFAAAAAATASLEQQPVPPVLSQLPQLYQIVSMLPPGIIYTQAQSISTSQTSVTPSVRCSALPSNGTSATAAPANSHGSSSTPVPAMAAGTFVAIKTPTGAQVSSQPVQSPMLLQAPGLAAPSYVPVGNNTSSLVKVFAQAPPRTQVFVRSQPATTSPAPSVRPAFTLVRTSSQVPSGSLNATTARGQAPPGKPLTLLCGRDQLQMQPAVVFCNQTTTGMQSFFVASNQGQPRAATPVVVQSQAPSGHQTPMSAASSPAVSASSGAGALQAPANAAATVAAPRPPGPSTTTTSTATAVVTKPLFRIPAPGSKTLLIPLPNQPVVATGTAGQRLGVPSPAGVSPQVSQTSTAGHPSLSQCSAAIPSQVSISKTVCPAAASTTSKTLSTGTVSISTDNPLLPAAPTQPPAPGPPSDSSAPLILTSDTGPLRILFMFLNQSRELALAQRMRTRWHYKDVFSCRQCGATSRQPSLVVLHRYRHRRALRKHRCCCGRVFEARLHLLRHQMLHADSTRYICTACGESFEGAQRLLLHKASCRQVRKRRRKRALDCWRPFVCTCGLQFVRPSALLWHKLNNSKHKQKARNEMKSSPKCCGELNALPGTG